MLAELARPGRRAVIGGIEPRTFKHNTDRQEHLAQRLLSALGTASQLRIGKMGSVLKAYSAIFTLIRINWHNNLAHTIQAHAATVL